MKTYTFDTNYFKQIDTEEKAYWLGFIAADGYLNKRGNTLGICLDVSDFTHLEKFKKSINYTGEVFTRKSQFSKEYKFTEKAVIEIYSRELSKDINMYGLDYQKSKSLSVIYNIPEELMHHFIRGHFDGDGCFFFSKGKKETHTGSPGITIVGTKSFLEFISKFIPDVPKSLRHDKRTEGSYILYLRSVKRYKNFTDYIYKDATIFLDRKFLKHQQILNKIK
jgi:hypothetical protein